MDFCINGFHTSENRGNVDYVKQHAPFLSRNEGQWLGQGYYFWTEILMWAQEWSYKNKIITEFEISIPREKVLDLVGSLLDQEKMYKIFIAYCVETNDPDMKYATVSKIIHYLQRRQKSFSLTEPHKADIIFPFWAIRAKDGKFGQRVNFKNGRWEKMTLLERHQLCVYEPHKVGHVQFKGVAEIT